MVCEDQRSLPPPSNRGTWGNEIPRASFQKPTDATGNPVEHDGDGEVLESDGHDEVPTGNQFHHNSNRVPVENSPREVSPEASRAAVSSFQSTAQADTVALIPQGESTPPASPPFEYPEMPAALRRPVDASVRGAG